ncbi:MAG: NUDIX hydrolase [Proteobacteria bacterium]|nr:NUDIX hydrolase [Pseudomonadota bacterium]
MSDTPSPKPVLGVAAVIWNDRREVLLIRRTKEPRKGQWSLPGGKVEFGESLEDAVRREVREETGIEIALLGLAGVAETVLDAGAGAANAHFVLIDYSARAVSGEAIAASDAADATWFSPEQVAALPLWSETRRMIAQSARDVWGS